MNLNYSYKFKLNISHNLHNQNVQLNFLNFPPSLYISKTCTIQKLTSTTESANPYTYTNVELFRGIDQFNWKIHKQRTS